VWFKLINICCVDGWIGKINVVSCIHITGWKKNKNYGYLFWKTEPKCVQDA
jgi:hypothetical protein